MITCLRNGKGEIEGIGGLFDGRYHGQGERIGGLLDRNGGGEIIVKRRKLDWSKNSKPRRRIRDGKELQGWVGKSVKNDVSGS